MKSITIHNIDDTLDRMIREQARVEGTSLNKTIQGLLEQALGIRRPPPQPHREDFEVFCGAWVPDDLQQFEAATAALSTADEEDWR